MFIDKVSLYEISYDLICPNKTALCNMQAYKLYVPNTINYSICRIRYALKIKSSVHTLFW